MFKSFFTISFFLFSITALVRAQNFVSAGVGYNFSAATDLIIQTSKNQSSGYLENNYGSFGQGADFRAAFGRMITPAFGFEVDVNYRAGNKLEYRNYSDNNRFVPLSYTSHYWGVSPSVILKVNNNLFTSYIKAGVVFAFPQINNKIGPLDPTYYGNIQEVTNEYSGRLAFGYSGSIGAELSACSLCYFAEINFTALSWKPGKYKYTYNGASQEYTLKDDNGSLGPNDSIVPRMFPFSAFGLNLGVKYNF